jgi:hypothetical protein
MSKELWANLEKLADEIVTPQTVLMKYASELTEATDGLIEGSVSVERSGNSVGWELLAVAPVLDNYSVTLLAIRHDLKVYPVEVWSSWLDEVSYKAESCATKDELAAAIEKRLASAEVQKVLASLLAQVRST